MSISTNLEQWKSKWMTLLHFYQIRDPEDLIERGLNLLKGLISDYKGVDFSNTLAFYHEAGITELNGYTLDSELCRKVRDGEIPVE